MPVFMTFSARTSANQTQDIIDSKMDKRRKVAAGAAWGRMRLAVSCTLASPVARTGAWPPH